jgi:putative ATP-dependent endonuclease of OLD family
MYISFFSLRNYRNFRNVRLEFNKGINTILGENGSGKTNLFQALRILLDGSLPRYYNFYPSDFNRALVSWAGHWIIISVEFANLDTSEEAQSLAMLSSGHMGGTPKGSYSCYFRPKYNFRKELYDYSLLKEKTNEGLQLLLNKILPSDYEVVFLGRGSADFSDDIIYEKYVGDFDKIIFPNPDDKEEFIYGVRLPNEINIPNEVSCTFIKALRDVESDLRSFSNNPLINLLRGREKTVEITKQDAIVDSVNKLNEQISSLDEVKDLIVGIDKSIKEAVGTTYAPNIDIKSELPNEMDKLFQSLKLWVGDPDDLGYKGKIWELSLGGANLIYLSLKLLEYEKVKTDKIANFLLIEEPESHIHTHIQKTLFNNLNKEKTQVIISTHSTQISATSKISSMNILSRGDKCSLVFNPSKGLSLDDITRIERYLDAIRTPLLFAKGVILVEGDAELILIPTLFKKVFGVSLDEIGVSLIGVGSTGFENIALLFHNDRIKKYCSILTDLDTSVTRLPLQPEEDNDFQKYCRRSQKSGKERLERLNQFIKNNEFLNVFLAKYTFEVDFLLNGNSFEATNVIDKVFKDKETIKSSKEKLESGDFEKAGTEILRVAKYFGKGWFALLLSNEILYNTYIPEYILKSIAFSTKHMNIGSLHKAVLFRLNMIRNNVNDEYHVEALKFLNEGKSPEELVNTFINQFTKDPIAILKSMM